MNDAHLIIDPALPIGPIQPELFGPFVEHLGRAVYDGIYEPGNPAADECGSDTEVIGDLRGCIASEVDMVRMIESVVKSGYVGAALGNPKHIEVSFDECTPGIATGSSRPTTSRASATGPSLLVCSRMSIRSLTLSWSAAC